VTADPEGVLSSGMDAVLRGESELAFPALIKRFAHGLDFGDLAGVGWRSGDRLFVNPRALPVDVNDYWSFSPRRGMFGPIEITRGCPFACSFCQTSHIFGGRPRHRTIESIVRQAITLRPTARRVVRLLSPNAFSYGSRDGRQLNLPAVSELLRALRQAIAPRDRIIFGYFPSEVRPEHVVPEALDLVRQFADNDEIVIGAQSGSERMLAACHRGHTVEHVLAAVRTARKFGFKIIVDFIFGLPGETEADACETLAVMTEVSRLGARIHPHAFAPLPQTAFAGDSCGQVPVEVTQALEALRCCRGLYENEPGIAKIAQRDAVPEGG
jgi:B12-binding domain/radical SAM domain protein